jgi:pyruvate/2-oxoglutarate dehydrogenase complex dihydrolipoamide acyltransferase (E2) component
MPEPLPYRLPDLGEGMAEAEIVRWEVAVGDHVERDQIVVHVQTDKAEVELPVPHAGTVTRLGGEVGDVLQTGATVLELVADGDAAPPDPPPDVSALHEVVVPPPPTPEGRGEAAPVHTPVQAPVQAAPPARKLAKELGVDLAAVAGSGPYGRVTAADVRAAAGTGAAGDVRVPGRAAGERREPLRGVKRAMARNMAAAWREVPHISLFDEIDARPVRDALRAARELSGDDSLTLTALFVRAAVIALGEQPILNATFDASRDELVYHDARHVGVAVASPQGLVVPVVHDAQARSLRALGEEINRLTSLARAGGLPPEEISGATFTLTNYGTEGGRFATPIVRPPQVAIFGCGAIRVRPVVDGDAVLAAPALPLALSADHRVIDGHDATTFLDRMAALLGEPLALLVDGH